MGCTQTDLTLEAVFADPMIGAVMRADRVDARRLEAWLRSKARMLGHSHGETAHDGPAPQARRVGSQAASTAASAWAW